MIESSTCDGKVSASTDVVLGVPQGSVLWALFILYTSELFHILGNHIMSYANDTTINAVSLRPLSPSQVMESLNQYLAACNICYLKWHEAQCYEDAIHGG